MATNNFIKHKYLNWTKLIKDLHISENQTLAI